MDTWILEMVRRRSRRRVLAWIVALASVVTLAFAQRRYVHNFVAGPFDLNAADLETIDNVRETPRYFARVTGSRAIETGLQEVTVRRSGGVETDRSVSATYYALVVGERYLVFKSAHEAATTVEGTLAPLPTDVARELLASPDIQKVGAQFYAFYVDNEPFRLAGYLVIGGLLALAFAFVKFGVPAWRYTQDPDAHPVAQRVAAWGDPADLSRRIEGARRSPRYKGRRGWRVTDEFLIRTTFFSVDVLRLSDLLWAYKKVTKHSMNFIPTGKAYEAVLQGSDGGAAIGAKQKVVDQMLEFAAAQAPWAVFGHSQELEAYFTKHPADFAREVEERRHGPAEQAPSHQPG